MSKQPSSARALTARQQFWLEHLQAWQAQSGSLRDYAREHELSVTALYTAKRWFKAKGVWQGREGGARRARQVEATLVPVKLSAPVTRAAPSWMRVHLPNGIVVEVPEQCEATRGAALVRALVDSRP